MTAPAETQQRSLTQELKDIEEELAEIQGSGREDIHTYGHLLRIQCSLQICKPNCPTRSGSKSHFRAYHRASSMRKQKKRVKKNNKPKEQRTKLTEKKLDIHAPNETGQNDRLETIYEEEPTLDDKNHGHNGETPSQEPGDPEDPEESGKPEDPEDPGNTEDPENPEIPEIPEIPEDPEVPEEPKSRERAHARPTSSSIVGASVLPRAAYLDEHHRRASSRAGVATCGYQRIEHVSKKPRAIRHLDHLQLLLPTREGEALSANAQRPSGSARAARRAWRTRLLQPGVHAASLQRRAQQHTTAAPLSVLGAHYHGNPAYTRVHDSGTAAERNGITHQTSQLVQRQAADNSHSHMTLSGF
ncbi:unnamed protein product [Trichogramma brassicae]|uniref:Uncharacterized protein n=1 Tax=Trichogramma brassicae TaxID=86971 RepID=A0A6H5I281_9HYME|nr:unnamed protein product [Trichogramma brassicae]